MKIVDADIRILCDRSATIQLSSQRSSERCWQRSDRKEAFVPETCKSYFRWLRRMTIRSKLKTVKIGSRFATLTALLVLIGMPAMACFVPRQLLNSDEHTCCRNMADQCGSKRMPSPQSCCKFVSQDQQPYVSSTAIYLQITNAHSVLALLPPTLHMVPVVELFPAIFVPGHSPPVNPPETSSILRI